MKISLATCREGNPRHVLVTGDRDLLDIVANLPVKIVNPRGFWDLVRKIE